MVIRKEMIAFPSTSSGWQWRSER